MPKTEAPKILIRTDATKDVALGHLKRCIALALKLREKGASILFVIADDGYASEILRASGFEHKNITHKTGSGQDMNDTLDYAISSNSRIVIADSYNIDNEYVRNLMAEGLYVVSLTDPFYTDIISHIVVNGSLNAEGLNYPDHSGMTVLAGIGYLILGMEFWSTGGIGIGEGKIENVFITMGGVDHYDLTTRIIRLLDKIDMDFDITAVIGPYYDNLDSIRSAMAHSVKKVELVISPPSLLSYMKRSSMAFSAGGQTLYELAVLGRPTIGISLWENQAGNVGELAKAGAIEGITYSGDEGFDKRLELCMLSLANDNKRRESLSRKAASLVDGRGADRVAAAILTEYDKWRSKDIFAKKEAL